MGELELGVRFRGVDGDGLCQQPIGGERTATSWTRPEMLVGNVLKFQIAMRADACGALLAISRA